MAENAVLDLYRKFSRFPFGVRLFSWYGARKAPYFSTISPRLEILEPNHCQLLIKKRKRVQNHIGTMHVIAIANGLEMAMGFMAEASIPKNLRWIPKGMTLEYPAKADSDIRCSAQVDPEAWVAGDMLVAVKAVNASGTVVVNGTIKLWISEKPTKKIQS